jgi:hypothetical protein
VLLRIKRILALAVCLGSLLAVQAADIPRKLSRELPDPFALNRARAPSPAAVNPGERSSLRIIWSSRGRGESFALLFAACLCLIALELKVNRRTNGRHDRLAGVLAGALRGGALDSIGEKARFEGPIWSYAADDEEPEPVEMSLTRVNRSRYQLLAYDVGDEVSQPHGDAKVTVSYLGGGPDPDAPVRDDELLLGVPREFLKREAREPNRPAKPRLALTTGSTEGHDPGQGIVDLHAG